MPYKRTNARQPFQEECILISPFGSIETQTVDISKMGLGVKTDRTSPFKNGCELAVCIPSKDKLSHAKLIWTKKDVENNAIRLGLKLSTGAHFLRGTKTATVPSPDSSTSSLEAERLKFEAELKRFEEAKQLGKAKERLAEEIGKLEAKRKRSTKDTC